MKKDFYGAIARAAGNDWAVHAGGAIVALAVAGILYSTVLGPARRERESVKQDRASLEQRRSEINLLENKLLQARAELRRKNEDLSRSVALKNMSQLNRRISELTAAAEESGLTVLGVEPGEPLREARDYAVVPITVRGAAVFPDFAAFLTKVHDVYRDTAVAGFDLASNQTVAASEPVYELKLHWFTLADGAAPAAGSDGAGGAGSKAAASAAGR
ncbi:MAG TPA: type 4a pilus biogenesis protein PilO [Phycisphaerales bacterium]|nr:type 4a pilus biogenesis protein PilO [Phycisphaerales bacterium]